MISGKSQYKPLTEADIEEQTDTASFKKGRSYYNNGMVYDTVLREGVLKARCEGSEDEAYFVEAVLAPVGNESSKKILSKACSCPRGGFCKHVVAMLLAWVHEPESFEVRQNVTTLLKAKSREELLFLLEQLIKKKPELESLLDLLLELPVPGTKTKTTHRPVDAAVVKRQVSGIIRNAGYDWGAASKVAQDLDSLVETAVQYSEAGQWRNAQTIFTILAEEALDYFNQVQDDDGDLSGILDACASGLANYLDNQPSLPLEEKLTTPERLKLLKFLYEMWKFDSEYGAFEEDLDKVIAGNVTDEERKVVEGWAREEMRSGTDFSANWHNKKLLGFIATLKEGGTFSDEDMLAEYFSAGLYKDYVDKLVELDRLEEAFNTAREKLTGQMDVLAVAARLVKFGGVWTAKAIEWIEAQLKEAEKPPARRQNVDYSQIHNADRYREWLGENYLALGKLDQALNIRLKQFEAYPSTTNYTKVKEVATLPGQPAKRWEEVQFGMLGFLEKQKNWGGLISIYLLEKEISKVLSTLKIYERERQPGLGGIGFFHINKLEIAQAAESDYPLEAIPIYQEQIDTLIRIQGRSNYQQAAEYLKRIKKMYLKLNREADWQKYIGEIRSTNTKLRALQEELNMAKL
jgi:uncharacterized Zn finger protein/tetratricopeptide (TPR) repeat protein